MKRWRVSFEMTDMGMEPEPEEGIRGQYFTKRELMAEVLTGQTLGYGLTVEKLRVEEVKRRRKG